MAIRRGTFYEVPAFRHARGIIVITNDEWNEALTEELSGVLVYSDDGPGRTAIADTDDWGGPLLAVPKAELGRALRELSSDQVAPLENAICEQLGLRELLSEPPRAPTSMPGAIDYPRWAAISFVGDRVGTPPERKRRVVVSHDAYNRALGGAVCIRTTTSARRGGRGIPTLRDGTKAVCVLPTFYATRRFDLARRPVPGQLFVGDMCTLATGLVDALSLDRIL